MTDKLPNGLKLVFVPGCFDNFEGTQEELDALVKEIEEEFASGSFLETSNPVDFTDGSWSEEDISMFENLVEGLGDDRKRKLN